LTLVLNKESWGKILLVDDNEGTTKMLSTYLNAQKENYEVTVANTGFQALDYYMKFKPNVVVLDLSMPGMDGIETLSRIFKMDMNANVIIASATDAQRTIEICLDKGAMGFITKPYSPKELVGAIKNALRGGIYKRDLITFFSRGGRKIESSLQKIVGNDVSVVFKDVEVTPHYSNSLNPQSVSSITSVPEIKSESKIDVPSECLAFTTKIGGQLDGTIVSVTHKDFATLLQRSGVTGTGYQNESLLESFNIINSNLLSALADAMNFKIDILPIRPYIKDKDGMIKGKDLTKVTFAISWKEITMQLEIYLWLNMAALFKRTF